MPVPLSRLPVGWQGRIVRMEGQGPFLYRLMALGLIEGTEVKVIRRALLGDPLEIEVDGEYHLTLRKHEADHIWIEEAL